MVISCRYSKQNLIPVEVMFESGFGKFNNNLPVHISRYTRFGSIGQHACTHHAWEEKEKDAVYKSCGVLIFCRGYDIIVPVPAIDEDQVCINIGVWEY
jgi:hypothetical protein